MCHADAVLTAETDTIEPLLDRLQRSLPLGRGEAERVVAEVVAWFDETPEAFVGRRHRELQRAGVRNARAYEQIADELAGRPVPGPRLSVRQVRRVIYG